MKKRLVKVMSLVTISAMAISLAACGGAAKETASSAAAEPAAAESTAESAAAESAAESVAAESEEAEPAEEEETAESEAAEATADGDGFVIGFSNCYIGNTWRTQYIEEVQNKLDEYKNQGVISDYIISNANNDITEQLNQVNSMINSGCDAIILDPISLNGMEDVVENAQENGIIVVIAEQDSPYPGTYGITQHWADQIIVNQEYMGMKLGEGDHNIAYISGVAGIPTCTCRDVEVEAYLEEHPNIHEIASEYGEWSTSVAQNVMSTFLNTYGDSIEYVLAHDCMAEGILQAYANAGITPKGVSGDCTRSFLKTWANEYPDLETICAPCATSPGMWSVDLAVGLLQGKTVKDDVLKNSEQNPELKNLIELPIPYVILHENDINGGMPEFISYMEENYPTTAIYSREEALEKTEGMPDGYLLGAEFNVIEEVFE